MEQLKLEFGADGVIRTMYKDGLEEVAKIIDAEMTTTCRAAHVEWEEQDGQSGWTIRAVHNKELAVRIKGWGEQEFIVDADPTNPVAFFSMREEAIRTERGFFFKLLPPKEQRTE
jgi:hypothetical protein